VKHAFFLILPNTHILDLAGPLQIMASLKELGIANVAVNCIGPQCTVKAFQNLTLSDVKPMPACLPPNTVLFVIGSKIDASLMRSEPWKEATVWLRDRASHAGASSLTICGICTGTLLLARAGLLDGYLCTTHHRFTQQLRQQHPKINVLENRIYVKDRNIWTSAGVSSGIDLALHVIAEHYGQSASIRVARENVVSFRRFGADPALNALIRHRSHCNALVHEVQDAISRDLSLPLTSVELAKKANFSVRHLSRVFLSETGLTIHQYQTELRMDRVRSLLLGSKLPLERIAEECGFGSVQALRACWNKGEIQTPSALRQSTVTNRASHAKF
jgi:transcriptional regulator GlxA family with amidase domain